MIKFQKVKCKNFFSVGNQPIEIYLDKSPTTLITGSNGSGKSSVILDSIYFALFNKPFRNIKKPNIVNSINDGGLEVEIDFIIGPKQYKVIRGIKPNKFEIYEDDNLIDQDAAVKDYQKFLEENILGGLNEKVFKQVVVIGSADYQPFMQLKAADRREVIEELLDITIFSEMLSIAKEKLSILKESLRELDYSIKLSEEKLKLRKEASDKAKKEAQVKKQKLQEEVQKENDKIEGFREKIEELRNNKKELQEKAVGKDLVEKSLNDLQKLMNDLKNTKKTHNNQVVFFSENDNCPTCQQNIGKKHKDKLVSVSENKLAELDSAIDRVNSEIDKKKENKKKFEKIEKKIHSIDNEIFKNETNINSSKKYIERMNDDIKSVESPKSGEKIRELKEEYDDLVQVRKDKLAEQSYYTVVSGMLKDGGIKTKIIRQYIPLMNKIINDYLVRFGLPIEFTLDENFNEVIKSRHRDKFQYNNFSEGEKQRIDTALLLAWRQIAKAKNTTNTNLLIMDETFDSSLDTAATEELLNILLEMDKNTNIFVVSHKHDLSDKLRSHIEFEKQGNFTHIKSQPD